MVNKKQNVETKELSDLPLFFKDKIETLGHVSRLTPEYQVSLYRDATRIVHFCQNPVRLWRFQKLSSEQQRALIPGLYQKNGVRSQKRALSEAKMYMRYYAQQKSRSFIRSFWNRFRNR